MKRFCKICGKELIKQKSICNKMCRGILLGKINTGRKKSDETRFKLSKALKGRIFTNTHKENIKIAQNQPKTREKRRNSLIKILNIPEIKMKKEENARKTMQTKEYKDKISRASKGRKHTEEAKRKISKALTGIKHTPERKYNERLAQLNLIHHSGGVPRLGRNETKILNEQEQKDKCKIKRQYYITTLGYWVDGYCEETNTVYEVYEKAHNKNVFKDLERENEICKKLSCDFIIIWDNL